jgi:adenylate cyclase
MAAEGRLSRRRVRLFLLGSLRAEVDGRCVDIRGSKSQALLGYLALPAGRRHARAHLAGLLWGDMSEDRARHNLRQCLSALRNALGEGVLVNEGHTVFLDSSAVEVDTALLERAAPSRMVDEYQGELLEGLGVGSDFFDEWLAEHRSRLRELLCRRLDALAAERLAAGDVAAAIEIARRQLALDPTLEEAHRALMELYARTGRHADAVRQYGLCVKALRQRLGVAPGAETVRLYERLRQAAGPVDAPRPDVTAMMASAPTEPSRPSIVVLPFANRSGDADRDYLGIGLAEDITTALSRFSSLFVISPVTTFALRGRERDARHVGRALGVRYIVQGSVVQSDDRIRVTVHLVDAHTAIEVWAQRYDGTVADVFTMQDEIIAVLVATLVGRVEAAVLERIRRRPPDSLDAYDAFLRGKEYHHRFTREDNTRALAMFERAIALEPTYALAYAWLACALFQRTRFERDSSLLTRCVEAIQKAYALDEGESEVHRILGACHLNWKDFDKAEYHHERALALNPNDDRIVCQCGELRTYFGRPEDGERLVRHAMRLNPYTMPRYWLRLARALYHQRRFEEALDALHRENVPVTHHQTYLTAVLARLGRRSEARAIVARLEKENPGVRVGRLTEPLPYRRPADLEAVAEGLRLAGVRR